MIGGGLSAYISSTFMKAQAEASAQLREFFFQPVEFARVLAAERLLEGMEEVDRSKTRSTMIAAMMNNMITRPETNRTRVIFPPYVLFLLLLRLQEFMHKSFALELKAEGLVNLAQSTDDTRMTSLRENPWPGCIERYQKPEVVADESV